MNNKTENPGQAIMAEQIDIFFDEYQQRFNDFIHKKDSNTAKTAEAFTENFIAASPSGIFCGKKGPEFNTMIEQGYNFYRSIGMTSMEIISKDIELLDDIHAITKVRWKSEYIKQNGEIIVIVFDVIYLLQVIRGICRIFCYITGDERETLKEFGIVEE